MMLLKSLFSFGLGTLPYKRILFKGDFNKASVSSLMSARTLSHQRVSKALELVTAGPIQLTPGPPHTLVSDKPRPLVVMLAWISAERKHLDKYCELYLRRGYDVLTVRITPWQLLWPIKGSQVVAEEVLQFLDRNTVCQPILLHGFSIGGYVWGEVMVKMHQDKRRYQPVIDRIIGQTWDSAADITDMPDGMPLAVFPQNTVLRMALSKYIKYHLKAYHDQATVHYQRSSQMFYQNLVHTPALMLCSKTDPIGSVTSNLRVKEAWESIGIQVAWKCWDDSKHVSHFIQHKVEYTEILDRFLDNLSKANSYQEESVKTSLREKLQAKL